MRRTALALTLALLSSAALAQQVNDVQLRPGSSSLWGASFNANNNQVIDQFNTAGSVVDSFRWFQGTSVGAGTQLLSIGPTGSVYGAATGGRQGPGTINTTGTFVNGVPVTVGGAVGGTNGQIQYNNSGIFGGFTTSGDATINTASGALTLATVNGNIGTWGSATLCSAFTVNAKGLITSAANSACTPAIANVTGLGTGIAAALAINAGSAGAPVLFNGAGGTPSSLTLTNATGLPLGSITGFGTGVPAALAIATGTNAGSFVTYNGPAGTPSAINLTAGTNLPISTGVSGLAAGIASWLATPSSANLRTAVTDETGTGSLYFQGGDIGTPSAGVGTNLTALNASNLSSGTLPAARTNGHMNGTATNDNAAAGEVGELLTNGASPALTTATTANCGQITLTAGDWDVYASGIFSGAGATVTTNTILGINNVSATMPAFTAFQYFQFRNSAGITDFAYAPTVGPFRVSITGASQTWYCVAQAVFTVSTFSFQGAIRARRAR